MKKNIILYSLLAVLVLFLCEQIFKMPYMLKTAIKLPLFLIFPIYLNRTKFHKKLSLKMDFKSMKLTILVSTLVFLVILLAYFLLNSFIDISIIKNDLSNRMMLSGSIVLYAGLYTIFINSLVEEIFFRGFIFQGLFDDKKKYISYVFSSSMFALYHIAIFKTWFGIEITMLIMLGLFIGGLIFAYFVEKTNSILSSWAIHISADLAIVLIGFKYLELIV